MQHLNARSRQKQNLTVDSEFVHTLDSAFTYVAELFLKLSQEANAAPMRSEGSSGGQGP